MTGSHRSDHVVSHQLNAQVVPELPQSALFTQAADLERQLDAAMASQRAYITALVGGQKRIPKKLRLMLQSRHFQQEPRSGTGSPAGVHFHTGGVMPSAK